MDFSRDPNDYRPDPNGHFNRRIDEREIPPTAIRRCIESGEVQVQRENNPTRVAFSNTFCGVLYTVVVNPERGFAVTVFRGLPHENDEQSDARSINDHYK